MTWTKWSEGVTVETVSGTSERRARLRQSGTIWRKWAVKQKFYDESAQAKKKETLSKLNSKLRDYKEAIKFKEKFKGLRFFERRKLERKLKQILKKIEEQGKTPEFEEEENKIRKDIEYVKVHS